ncbi:MAG: protein DnrP [Methylophaga sp.]|nr:protein DnrP [Methylophaga sp.]
MSTLLCKHCAGNIEAEDSSCPHCGIPLPPHHATQKQRHFVLWFVALVLFCFFMMVWLPPDWSPFTGR